MTPTVPISKFAEFKAYLERNGYFFEERPNQEFLAKKVGVSVNLYKNGKVTFGGTDLIEINKTEEYISSLTISKGKRAQDHLHYGLRLITISTPFNADFVEELKAKTKTRRWNPDQRLWTVNLDEHDVVLELVNRYFDVVEDKEPIRNEGNSTLVRQPSTTKLEINAGDKLDIWTDGACLGNPGPGGYAAIISRNAQKLELTGGFKLTTNNRMEIMGVLAALEAINAGGCQIIVYTDSAYLVNSMTKGRVRTWKAKNWQRKTKKVPNSDLWERLLTLCENHKVEFVWIKGHNLQPENERCNMLAEAITQTEGLPVDIGYNEDDLAQSSV